jgi:4-amino-4-deoxy-L-arabinose transferase-like glycosyltransferase
MQRAVRGKFAHPLPPKEPSTNWQLYQRVASLLSIDTPAQREIFLLWFVGGLAGVITFYLRGIYLGRSYDIFIDEITYLHIAQNVAEHLQVTLYGKTFYLHPPAFFFIEAAFLKGFDITGSTISQIYAVRYINAAFAGLSTTAILMIARHIGGWPAGLIAAALFALDPFIIKMNSLNLLDTSAVGWVLAGYWALLSTVEEKRNAWTLWHKLAGLRLFATRWLPRDLNRADIATTDRSRPPGIWRPLLAGCFFGLALLTKDMTACLTLVPLAVCFLLNWAVPRITAVVTAMVTTLTYLTYPLTVFLIGDWDRFATQKLSGIARLAGLVKITGVNREHGPSLLDTVLTRIDQFGSTYLLFALGMIGLGVLLLFGRSASRLIAIWTASAYALLAYAALFGTLEEQFFYFLVLPSLLATVTGGAVLIQTGLVQGRAQRLVFVSLIVLVLFLVGWNSKRWIESHFTPDNGYERVLAYLERHVPPESRVAATSETAQFLLDDYKSGPWGDWYSVEALLTHMPDYVLVDPHALRWNYGSQGNKLLEWLQQHGETVFSVSRTSGEQLTLYRLDLDIRTGVAVEDRATDLHSQ